MRQQLFKKFTSILVALMAASTNHAALPDSIDCNQCADWNAEQAPFPITDNIYFVGTRGLSSLLIDTGEGLVLIDGGLPQSAKRIQASVKQLGFKLADVRYLVSFTRAFRSRRRLGRIAAGNGRATFGKQYRREVFANGICQRCRPATRFWRFSALSSHRKRTRQ